MKRLLLAILAVFALSPCAKAQVAEEAYKTWHESKFSMFIHFGLYSELGGVWEGQPVRRGYSEQIQSFAGIFSDWYGDTALSFNPTAFDADKIAALAKEAGMRSIVITTKHHDGFCMFGTKTTDYNSVDATPCGRDFVKELSEACSRAGIRLGLYFSIIDWHYPHAYPISSHNCDFITPQHHELSKQQVTELLTGYGPISELWFDMGSNTPSQSRELYELVHRLQPDCMVSGRVGNDQYDFAVMADNSYPEGALQCPWQSAASMFDETWSYRSWQERGSSHVKAMEKLRSLTSVVSHGGNFLLNIGPRGDGSVVEFERDVLQEMGAWLKENGDAIYGTEASPFRTQFDWGVITRKGCDLYLILNGTPPAGGTISLDVPGSKIVSAEGALTDYSQKGDLVSIGVSDEAYNDRTINVLRLSFDKPVEPQPMNVLGGNTLLTAQNATPSYSYSCFDYYSNYRSTVSYSWRVEKSGLRRITLMYTEEEAGKEIELDIDGDKHIITLNDGTAKAISDARLSWGDRYVCGPGSSVFDAASTIETDPDNAPLREGKWQPTDDERGEFKSNILETYFVMQTVDAARAGDCLVDVASGNGIEVYLNGVSLMKHLNPYRTTSREEKVLLPLQKGTNQIVLRLYNRFERLTPWMLRPSEQQTVYSQTLTLPEVVAGRSHTITVRRTGLPSQHTDTELANLRLLLK